MWILPKNYQLSSHFARDMVESKEDLTCQGLNIESSLMWRSKPTRLQTWLRRWKPDSYLPHLFTRILKHSQRSCFEEKLTLSLAAIRVSHSVQQETEKGQKTPDICGRTYGDTSNQLDLFNASLKMSKDTSALDSEKSSATWKKTVTEQRGEYSQRVKLAHHIKESESISWPTPDVAQAQKVSNRPNYGQLGLANHPEVHGQTVDRPKMQKDRLGRQGQVKNNTSGNNQEQFGKLNPYWVEHLMGIETGWTELGSWGTE